MTPDAARLLRDALTLDADQRAFMANALEQSLRDADDSDDVNAAWRAEAARRLAEVRSSSVGLINADDHYAHLRASLIP